MKRTYWKFTVTGSWPFPTDMLRRDRAKGATLEDAEVIQRLSNQTVSNGIERDVTVTILSGERPTIKRWKSFAWEVGDRIESVEIDEPLTDEEKLEKLEAIRSLRLMEAERQRQARSEEVKAAEERIEVRRLREQLEAAEKKLQVYSSNAERYREMKKETMEEIETLLLELDEG